ncbi:MAG: hypothetical protein ABJ275_12650 [Maricaulaceae bacterium]
MTMITNWTDEKTEAFRKEIFTFSHELASTDLFSDDALIKLIGKHPAELTDVCTMGPTTDTRYPNKLRTCDFRGCSAEDLFHAAKTGRVWINLRKAMNVHSEYSAVLDQMYGDIAKNTGTKAFNANGGILITSPVARTPYHFDKTETILWHVRGPKRIFLYPVEDKFISDVSYEKAVANMIEDDLPYDPSFDKDATIIDLQEGQAVTWPLSAPHRVDNHGFCVSVTTEFSSRESALKNSAMIANATMRNKLGLSPSWSKQSQINRLSRSVLGAVLKKAKLAQTVNHTDYVSYKVDPKVHGGLLDIEPFARDF